MGRLVDDNELMNDMTNAFNGNGKFIYKFISAGGSVAEWSARRTRNPAVPGSNPALATCWICARSSRVQILGHACKQPTGRLLPIGVFNPVMLYLNYLFLNI